MEITECSFNHRKYSINWFEGILPMFLDFHLKIPCKGRVSLCRNVCHLASHLIIKGLGPSNEHYRMCDQLQSPFGDNLKALRPGEMWETHDTAKPTQCAGNNERIA